MFPRHLVLFFYLPILLRECWSTGAEFCYDEHGECHAPQKFLLSNMSWAETIDKNYRLKIITVATEETEGFQRFMRSARYFDLDVEVHGMSDEWKKQSTDDEFGGGKKLDALRTALLKYKDQKKLIIMFTDSYETIITGGKKAILNRFMNTGANVLISEEDYCWPDRSLKARYFVRAWDSIKYQCSFGVIGFAPSVYKLLSLVLLQPKTDKEVGYRHFFLDQRKKYSITWDRRSTLFQNLNGYHDVVVLNFTDSAVLLRNTGYKTRPIVIHGNGPSKTYLTYLGNYVPNMWSPPMGCLHCHEGKVSLDRIPHSKWPKVLIGVFIIKPTPFLDTFLANIGELDYPQKYIDVFIHNVEEEHEQAIRDFIQMEPHFRSVQYNPATSRLTDQAARHMGMLRCKKVECDYYFSIDSVVSLTNTATLKILLEAKKRFIAPLVTSTEEFWKTNFWGDLTLEGKYIRSNDYFDIANRTRLGIWNVPYVRDIYLMSASVIERIGEENPFVSSEDFNQYFSLCLYLRDSGVFMYVTNEQHFGHLKTMTAPVTTVSRRHKTLYNLFDNKADWISKYIHPELQDVLDYLEVHGFEQPCRDVFMFPLMNYKFADHLIDEAEHQRIWLADSRIPGGYRNMATSTLQSIALDEMWRFVLKEFILPIARHLFHHVVEVVDFDNSVDFISKQWRVARRIPLFNDTSVLTVNVALNEAGPEYEGGGERFTRYDCTVRGTTKVGWATIRPGGFTHQFEAIPVEENTRYVLVSLLNLKRQE